MIPSLQLYTFIQVSGISIKVRAIAVFEPEAEKVFSYQFAFQSIGVCCMLLASLFSC